MNFDEQFKSVQRAVEKRTLDSGDEGRCIVLSQIHETDIRTLWDTCTKPENIREWFSPVTGNLQQGGNFQVENNASGTIERCIPPNEFQVTWEFDGGISWVQIQITEASGTGTAAREQRNKVQIQLRHIMRVDNHWNEYGAGAGGVGWDMALLGLAGHLQGIKMEDNWYETEEAKGFLTNCSEAWGEAAAQGGEDLEAVKSAVSRCTAFYVP